MTSQRKRQVRAALAAVEKVLAVKDSTAAFRASPVFAARHHPAIECWGRRFEWRLAVGPLDIRKRRKA